MRLLGGTCGLVCVMIAAAGCDEKPGERSSGTGTNSHSASGAGGGGGSAASASGGSLSTTGDATIAGAGGTTGAGGSGGAGAGGGPASCEGKPGPIGASSIEVQVGSDLRDANVYVPATYDPKVATPLVLSFHGIASSAEEHAVVTRMNAASDERGFIVVYPTGLYSSWNGGKCCGNAVELEIDDVGFAAALVDALSADYCVDPARVFATGLSSGAILVNRIGCELSEKIAAIAPVAGMIGVELADCQPVRRVPVLEFHGTDDTLVPYDGGGLFDLPSVDESVARWRTIDGCSDMESVTFDQGDSQCVSALDCGGGTEVILCTVLGGGHTWPGGEPMPGFGATTDDLDATNTMLDFFEKHPMP